MREGRKTHLKKNPIKLIFGKVNEGNGIKKNIGHISEKVNVSDEKIKKVDEGDKTYFFLMFSFLSLKLTGFFMVIGRNPMPFFLIGNALPESNAHAHLKQRKKHSGLIRI